MRVVGKVLSLYISNMLSNKQACHHIHLDIKGILEDKHYNQNIQRSILISSIHSYNLVKSHDININIGTLGENILVDFNLNKLNIGNRIKINNCLLEITQNCTLCKHLTTIDTKLPKLLKNDRGIFAKVIHSGTIHTNDDIYIY